MHLLPDIRAAILSLAFLPTAAADVTVKSANYVIVGPAPKLIPLRQAQLEWSARIFETLMGVRPPRGRVVLSDTPSGSVVSLTGEAAALVNTIPLTPQPPAADGSVWNLSWFLNERSVTGRGPLNSALTHEAAHLQLVFTVNYQASQELKDSYNGYGSFLPDWLDEAIAVFHEPESLKLARRQRFNPAARIPLKNFFTMSHPGTPAAPQVVRIEARTPEEARKKFAAFKATQQAALQRTADALGNDKVAVDAFYGQALATIEYLTARGGLPFFRFVVAGQNSAKSFDEILPEWREKRKEIERLRPEIEGESAKRPARLLAPGEPAGAQPARANKIAGVLVRPGEAVNQMPPSLELMEADFVSWVAKNYPKYRANLPRYPEK